MAVAQGWTPLGDAAWTPMGAFEARGTPSARAPDVASWALPDGPALVQLHALISLAESHLDGYDAYHQSARVPPPSRPSRMTLAAIRSWVQATPGQHHAIGRYQIIPATFDRLIAKTGLPMDTVFTARIQDMLANVLIDKAGYDDLRAGRIGRDQFMDQLAAIWAGLPAANGRSIYHGKAGNRATISRAFFAAQMARIFGGTKA